MSETEVRSILRSFCADLDRQARRVVGRGVRLVVMPAVFGAGIALWGCDEGPAPTDTTYGDTTSDNGPMPAYGVEPWDATPDYGPMPPYMAPDINDPGPTPEYAAAVLENTLSLVATMTTTADVLAAWTAR